MHYFDNQNKRLIYVNQPATPDYWDNFWKVDHAIRDQIIGIEDTFVSKWTKKYLTPEDGVILEGGCGKAVHVAALTNNGFPCIGVDYANETVQRINQSVPELDVRWGDVRCLDFEDASVAGYWSLGVIEHFWDGYESIGREMARVVKSGGYLFLTFPYMSPLRKLKAKLSHYPVWRMEEPPTNFYQFALDHMQVVAKFESWGFKLIKSEAMLGLRAAKEELGLLNSVLQYFYDYKGQSIPIRSIAFLLSQCFTLISAQIVPRLSVVEKWGNNSFQ
jgi:SAM-dependent methyltransferase